MNNHEALRPLHEILLQHEVSHDKKWEDLHDEYGWNDP